MNHEAKLVSVIMAVFNTPEHYLREAIESILQQTHRNMEFLIVDDASEESCAAILYFYKDERIRIICNKQNRGLTYSLNLLLREAKGDYIARMDSDDISLPTRLEEQINYMEQNSQIQVLATIAAVIGGEKKNHMAGIYRTFYQERIRVQLSFANIEFTHPTVLYRAKFLKQYSLYYDETIKKAQDYAMWVKCAEYGELAILQKPLFYSRIHEQRIGTQGVGEQQDYANRVKERCMARLLKKYTEEEKELYVHLRDTALYGTPKANIALIRRLVETNEKQHIYNATEYKKELFFWWFRKACYGQNRSACVAMLWNGYILRNIAVIILPELGSYIVDGIYRNLIRHKCARTLKR